MKELSLHILDLAQNSLSAGAGRIVIEIDEDTRRDRLALSVEDDGRGMDEETVRHAADPFYTTRKTRKVGLGIPLLEAAAERCDGYIDIRSKPNGGTKVTAVFRRSHIDIAPIGDIWDTMSGLVGCNGDIDFIYRHIYNGVKFEMDTREIRRVLGQVPITSPEVVDWIAEYIKEGIENLYGGVSSENHS